MKTCRNTIVLTIYSILLLMLVHSGACSQSVSVTTLYSFAASSLSDGQRPWSRLLQASDGNFYGTTYLGGQYGQGTIFRISSAGNYSVLYNFTGGADGGQPQVAALTQASDGNLYGTAQVGGQGSGTVFCITLSGSFTVIYTFSPLDSNGHNNDGAGPVCQLVQGPDGNFYGEASLGGAYDWGTLFRLSPAGQFTTLYTFTGGNDGGAPVGGLLLAQDGYLYGVAENGGDHSTDTQFGDGTLFRVSLLGTFTTLHIFNGVDGSNPVASLIQGSDGNFYGTTSFLDTNPPSPVGGTVFKLTPSGKITVLHSFEALGSSNTEGAIPIGGLLQLPDGSLEGTAFLGGSTGAGTIYSVTPSGNFTLLYTFPGPPANKPAAGLTLGSDGKLYGTTVRGGDSSYGTIFVFSPAPLLNSIKPTSANAGGPSFALTINGSRFTSSAVVNWTAGTTTTPLTTTYISATQLKAAVPSSLITNPGNSALSVMIPSVGTSNSKPFAILLTTLKITKASLSKNSDGSYTATLTLKNVGYLAANTVNITMASLGTASTSTSLPVSIGSIAAKSIGTATLTFPASAGTTGQVVILKVSGTFTGGTFSGSLKVMLP